MYIYIHIYIYIYIHTTPNVRESKETPAATAGERQATLFLGRCPRILLGRLG